VRKFSVVGIEDLNVRGMLKNSKSSGGVADVGLFEFRCELEYMAPIQSSQIVLAGRWYAFLLDPFTGYLRKRGEGPN